MIERLRIVNFQKHTDIRITFAGPGVTTIVGPSDKGKSAIIRALGWLFLNRPNNNRMRRRLKDNVEVKDDTVVTLWIDGHKLVRRRGDKVNNYQLDEETYTALGRDVPPNIEALCNIGEANFQKQLDQPYWFTESGPQVAAKLNAIVNLQIIDNVLDQLGSKARRARQVLTVAEERLEDAKQKKTALSFVGPLHEALGILEDMEFSADQAHNRQEALRYHYDKARQHRQQATALARYAAAGSKAVQLGTQAIAAQQRATALRALLAQVRASNKSRRLPKLDMVAVKAARDEFRTAANKVVVLRAAVVEVRKHGGHVSHTKDELGYANAALSTFTRDMKVCPVCQRPLSQ